METIRVAWLNQFDPLNPWAGGAERHIAEISTRLVEAGHEVTVFAERYLNSTREESLGGVRIVRPAGRLGMHLWAAESFRGSQPFDIIVRDLSKVLPWGPTSGWRIPSLAIVRHLNGSVLVNEVPLAAPALWTVERAYGRLLRDVLVVTEARATARRLVAIGIPPSHITLLKPGVDRLVYSPGLSERSPDPLVLYAGRLKRYKRVDLAMRAFAALKRDLAESKMLVVGEGVDSARLRALSTKLGILDCLEFTGKVSTSDLVHIYRRAWVHVQPSSAEGWGYTVLEAAATGTPTVAVAGTALDESVGPDCRKYLAHSADPDRLAESLELCIMDMRDEPDMIAKRMIAYASQFDWNLTAKSFEALLRTTLTGDPFAKGSTQSFSRALAESQ